MLKPYVCDCAAGAQAENCPADAGPTYARQRTGQQALIASQQAASTAVERASAEARLESESDEPSYRTLERKKDKEPPKDPLELYDPVVEEAVVDLSDTARAERLQETFGVAIPDQEGVVALTANFSKSPGPELLIAHPNNRLTFYGTDERIAQFKLEGTSLDPSMLTQLGLGAEQATAQAVRLVDDGTAQVILHWREETEAGEVAYKVGVFKVIGSFVGRIFVRTLAVSDSPDAEIVRRGAYEVLQGETHRFIRWIPADESGQLLTDQAQTLKWNRWEGVFRVPRPAPTAPRPKDLRSQRPTASSPAHLAQR